MKADKTIQELIEGYLGQTLEPEDLKAFEQKLATDTALQEEVKMAHLANLATIRNKLYEVQSIVKGIQVQEKKSRTTRRLLLGLGLALLVAAGIYMTASHKSEVKEVRIQGPSESLSKKVTTKEPLPVTEKNIGTEQEIPAKGAVKEKISDAKELSVPQTTNKVISEAPDKDTGIKEPEKTPFLPAETEPKSLADPCSSTSLEASVFTENACRNESNGRITVSGFKGGKTPYTYQVLNEANEHLTATQLAKGVYTILLEDGQKCIKKWENVVIKDKDCKKDFEFNPEMGEIFEIEEAQVSSALTIYGKDGNTYFYKTFAPGEKIQWNGASNSGEMMSGFFVFQIHYQDGKIRKGTVTAIR